MAQINPADAAFAVDRTAVNLSARDADSGGPKGDFAAYLGQVEASGASYKNALDATHARESEHSASDEKTRDRDPAVPSIAALSAPTEAGAIRAPLAAHALPEDALDTGTAGESVTRPMLRDAPSRYAAQTGEPTTVGDPLSTSRSTDSERANPTIEAAPQRESALPFKTSAGAPETQSRDGHGAQPGSPQVMLQPHPEALAPAVARALEIESAVFAANANRSSDDRAPALTASVLQPVEVNTAHDMYSSRANREETSPIMHRVIRGMHAMINHRGGVLTMHLQPPELGDLRIRMIVHGQRVTAQIDAETVQAQSLLKNNLGMLQRALEQQGMVVERLTVHLAQSGHTGESSERHDETDRHERPDAGKGESRGRRDEREHRHEEAGRDSRFGFNHQPPRRPDEV